MKKWILYTSAVVLLSCLATCKRTPYDGGGPGTITYRVYGQFDLVDPGGVPQLDIIFTTATGGTVTQNFLAADIPAAPSFFSWTYQTDYVEGQSYTLQVVVTAQALVGEAVAATADSIGPQLDGTFDLEDVGVNFAGTPVQENDFFYDWSGGVQSTILDLIPPATANNDTVKITDNIAVPPFAYRVYARQSAALAIDVVDQDGVEATVEGSQTSGLLDATISY